MINTKSFSEILLRRRNKLNVSAMVDSNNKNIDRVIIMMKNINAFGYTFSNSLIEYLAHITVKEQDMLYKELIHCLKEYTGANKEWNVMYPNFPEQVQEMDDWELFVNAIVHYISGGTLLPEYEKDERLPLFESSDLIILDHAEDEELDIITNNLISSKTSLSETDKEDMIWLFQNRGLKVNTLPEIPFKENVAIICSLILDNTSEIEWYNILHKYLKTATDILRFVTYLSGGDVSLSSNTKYISLPRKKRRLILDLLENCGNIEEDMKRHEIKWKRCGEMLHPGQFKKYEKVNKAFEKIRENDKIETFAGKVNYAYDHNNIKNLVKLLKTRPGEFARRLDSVLRNNLAESDHILFEFENVASQISVPVLLQLREFFDNRCIDDNPDPVRVFFPKGQVAKTYVVENELGAMPIDIIDKIIEICNNAILDQLKEKESLGKVYIDDSIKGYCVPQSQRSANASLKNVTRGSRFKLKENSKFIRLGIHWTNELYKDASGQEHESRTDIDLSCSFLDENFGYIDHISFTHLRNSYATHSGDITNALRSNGGAAEFIDIDIDKAKYANVKYAAVQVYGYTMTKFCNLEDMIFNWQEGEDSNCGDIFEPTRIQQSMNIGFDGNCGIPVVFDIENNEVIWCDLALTTSTSFPRCVEGNVRGLSATVMGICKSHKPQMYDLAILNALARGNIVSDRNDADVIFDQNTTPPIEVITKHIEVQDIDGNVINRRTETEEIPKKCRIITAWDTDVWQGEML